MSNTSTYTENTKGKNVIKMFVGVGVALIISLVLILAFALLIKWFDWSDAIIMPANIIIKIISISIGVLIVTKDGKSGAVKGAILGAVYILLCFLVFSLLNGAMIINISLLYDALLGMIGGAILGIISVTLKK